jgi:5-formyltetrahydrofolate cyclo-ligase
MSSTEHEGLAAKEKLRREMRAKLREMTPAFRAEASLVISQIAANLPAFTARRGPMTDLDCVFVPGMAFDHEGGRLGRGGGFYDSFLGLAPEKLHSVGLFFSGQKIPFVPREAHDQALRSVITEDGFQSFD